jgi:phenylalanyl-tRNA synthetase beta chain
MVVIEISKMDLKKLIRKDLTDEQINDTLFLLKVESLFEGDKITCELNPDRPDMFSVEGIARAMKGFLEVEKGLSQYEVFESKVILAKEKAMVRPHIACAVIENIEMSDELIKSLMQIQEKLHATIGRDRRKVAIGVHDFDKVKPPLIYKDVEEEKFVPLQSSKEMTVKQILQEHPKGKDYAHLLSGKYPIIYDKHGVISFPPIINSERTKLTEFTKNLFIDVTGTDEKAVNQVLNILVMNIAERSGKIGKVKVSNKMTPDLEPIDFSITVEEADKIIGLGLDENKIANCLEKMRFGIIKAKGGKIDALIPAYRTDILHKVDIFEDIAIGFGYNNIEPILPKIATIGRLTELEKFCSKLRELLIGLGFQETLNFTLISKEINFDKMLAEGKAVEISNPVSSEFSICRTWLLPSLMKVLSANKHRDYPQKVFEIGDAIVFDTNSEVMTKSLRKIAGVISYDSTNLTEMKSIIENVMENIGMKYEIRELKNPSFIETRAGEIIVNSKQIGFFGEINPEVLVNFNLEKPVIAFEMELG